MLCPDLETELTGLIGNEEMTRRQAHMLRAYSLVGRLPFAGDTTVAQKLNPVTLCT